ncbi:LOW QUALITY PROTEIN: uncharacterized protein [Procambarus clarkii]|uniref:LOW QUALITY PROTEIN: uncharacterized protein n=1 Tax=Procambarus clarkii TaxID=6728 RepID=UPI0037422ADC
MTTTLTRPSVCQPRRRAAFLWAWLWALAITEFGALADCPKVCECKWRDGKEVVACRDAHFIDIPRGLDPSTQVLDLRHNNLRILPRDSFVYTGLVNLQKVWLNFCNLMRLEKGAFRMLNNVVELDLSNNLLRTVPSEALMDMGGLRELRLAHNSLTTIPPLAFVPTPELVHLDLSHNSIAVIEEGALRALSRLEVLNLSDNKLMTMDASDLMLIAVLRVIHLEGNPWHCDCRLRPLRKWMQEHNLAASVPAVCTHPRWLTGRDWQLLSEEEFVCAPLVTAEAPRVLAAEGENVSLTCRVESEVEVIVTWLVGDSPLQNTSEAQRYTVVEQMGPYYSSFISNLTIIDVIPTDQGTYRCIAENRAGRREVNLTLQVSHEVAEVRIANVDDSYMKGGVFGGVSILVCILIIVCLLIYCKVRTTRPTQQEDDKLVTPQTSRESEGTDAHKMAGYHIVPTNDLEDPQPSMRRSQQTQSSWMLREASIDEFSSGKSLEASTEGRRQETLEVPVPLPTTTPSSVSYVEIPKSGIGTVRTTLEDPSRWKDHLFYNGRDALFYRMCGRSASQTSVGASSNGGQYPDLLDLPRSQYQQQQEMQQYQAASLPLHTLNPSYCTLPRTRARVNSDASGRPEREAGKAGLHLNTQPAPTYPEDAAYRSSSALNLALSEAASLAYAHLPSRGRQPFPPTTALTAAHHPQDLHDLIVAHRSQCTSGEGGAGSGQVPSDPYRFEYHAAQLEKFLQEYRCLQEQLIHMKQSYEAQHHRGSTPRLDRCTDALGAVGGPPPPPSHVGPLPHPIVAPPPPVELIPPPMEVIPPPPVGTTTLPPPAARPTTSSAKSSAAKVSKSYGVGHQSYSDQPAKQPPAGASAEPLKSILKKAPEAGKQHQLRPQKQRTTSASHGESSSGSRATGDPL